MFVSNIDTCRRQTAKVEKQHFTVYRRPANVACLALQAQRHTKSSFYHSKQRKSIAVSQGNYSVISKVEPYDVVVVGGGISGLATAQALVVQQNVKNILLTEADERVGGKITTCRSKDYLWEEGPNSCLINDALLQAATDAGVADQIISSDPKAPRFVLWDGRLRVAPIGLPQALSFDLLSVGGSLRALLGLFGVGAGRPPPQEEEESVEHFVRRTLGAEAFERLVEPFCSGVYAGNPARLSIRAAFGKLWEFEQKGGSIFRGAIQALADKRRGKQARRAARAAADPTQRNKDESVKSLKKRGMPTVSSFRDGLATLPNAMASLLGDRVSCGMRLISISKEESPSQTPLYRLTYRTTHAGEPSGAPDAVTGDEQEVQVLARQVVLCIPALEASEVFSSSGLSAAAAPLAEVDYAPVALVALSYDTSSIAEDRRSDKAANGLEGFGQLHPRSQGLATLGTIYGTALFEGRAPREEATLLSFVGGATDRGAAARSAQELVTQVDADLKSSGLIRADATSPRVLGVRLWAKAIPQFNIGHLGLVEAAQAALKQAGGWDGVTLSGNYVSGVALGRCVEFGYETAAKIAADYSNLQP